MKEFKVSKTKIRNALEWLKLHNPYYEDITIDSNILEILPENGMYPFEKA